MIGDQLGETAVIIVSFGHQLDYALLRIFDLEKWTISARLVVDDPVVDLLWRRDQTEDAPVIAECPEVLRIEDHPTASCDNQPCLRSQLAGDSLLDGAELTFAPFGENARDRPIARLDQLVGVDELHPELVRELVADSCLAGTHETREDEIVLRMHRLQGN